MGNIEGCGVATVGVCVISIGLVVGCRDVKIVAFSCKDGLYDGLFCEFEGMAVDVEAGLQVKEA